MLAGKKILLAVTGSIAAYKAALLTRLLIREGVEVRVIMTSDAASFITPLTLETLSRHPVISRVSDESSWNNHVELGLWADLMLIAPATANTLAKMANGLCDNMVTACYLSARCPVAVAPAMDLDMWKHPATQRNLSQLVSDGVQCIPVAYGELASGLVGDGRMAEPAEIVQMLPSFIRRQTPLSGKTIVLTAGPTHEKLDPVRFLGNASSGKMGIAIAHAAALSGARVILIYGPGSEIPPSGMEVIRVESAREMMAALEMHYDKADAVVFAAAVADYRPAAASEQKIKKEGTEEMQLRLVPNPDIAWSFGRRKSCIHIGFALESDHGEDNARKKLQAKNFDLVILNQTGQPDAGIGAQTNRITLFDAHGNKDVLPLTDKKELGFYIVERIAALLHDQS